MCLIGAIKGWQCIISSLLIVASTFTHNASLLEVSKWKGVYIHMCAFHNEKHMLQQHLAIWCYYYHRYSIPQLTRALAPLGYGLLSHLSTEPFSLTLKDC